MTIEKVANVFSKLWNPLRTLTKPQIERMLENARHGDDVRLQAVFQQIEQRSAIYQVCIQKRTSGIVNRKWDILPVDTSSREAVEQAKRVKDIFLEADMRNDDGLTEALKHLVLAAFRGRSAVKPFIIDGKLVFKKLENWNLLEYGGSLWWNPSSEETGWFIDNEPPPPTVIQLPREEVCCITNSSPVDIPGLMLYLRQLVGEQQWSRFVEKQGVPQVVINTPDGTPDTALDIWNQRALQIFEGGCGTLPYDAKINVLDSARGQDPFTSYIQHQMEMISILATGGTLMTIGGSTGLGSDLARVQQESFNSLVNQDAKLVANAMTACVVKKTCRELGLGEQLCRFSFIEDDEYSAQDYLDMATKLSSIGVKIDAAKLKEVTKLGFIDASEQEWKPPAGEPSKEWTPEERASLREEMMEAE